MAIITEHISLQDGKSNITTSGIGGALVIPSFSLPTDYTDTVGVGESPASRNLPVLAFIIDTVNPTALSFSIETSNNNGSSFTAQFSATFNSDVYHSIHEVINAGAFIGNGTAVNQIRFTRVSGSGGLQIGDVVLLVKRNVPDAASITATGAGGGDTV